MAGICENMCVLLVEDDAVARKMAEAALVSCGYRVKTAENGKQALDILESSEGDELDLILTDILMPEVNGLQLLDRVVQTPKWKQLPVTVMSTQDSIDNAANCIQKGAVEFLAKPVRKHKLSNLWQHVLRRKSTKDKETTEKELPPKQEVQQLNHSAPNILKQGQANTVPTWASQLPQAIVEIAFKPNGATQVQEAVEPQLQHSNSCSAFSAFIRCRGGSAPSQAVDMKSFGDGVIGAPGYPLQVNNLHIIQHPGNGAFRGSGMLTVQDVNIAEREGATKRRAAAIQKFREKKKARNFKKKVRYESRKRLAEQRPRIKGQFVRPEVAAAAAAAAATAASAAAAAATKTE